MAKNVMSPVWPLQCHNERAARVYKFAIIFRLPFFKQASGERSMDIQSCAQIRVGINE